MRGEVSKKHKLILISILLIVTFSISILAATVYPKVQSEHCEGNYITDCSGWIRCENYEIIGSDGYADGCSINAPDFCEEVDTCRMYDCGYEETECQVMKECTLDMCINQEYQACEASSETCSFFDELTCKANSQSASTGCTWTPAESCDEGYYKVYTSCSGEYKTTTTSGTCVGSFTSCPGDVDYIMPAGDQMIDDTNSDECQIRSCFGTDELTCLASGPQGSCYWSEYDTTTTLSCSSLSQISCLSNDGCIATYDCLKEKAKTCEACNEDVDCEDGLRCKKPYDSTTKKCVPLETCATSDYSLNINGMSTTVCSKAQGDTVCYNGGIYTCSKLTMQIGAQDWYKTETCASGGCIADECKPLPPEPDPVLLWKNKDDGTTYQTSMNNPKTINFLELPLNLLSWVEDPDMSKDDTFTIYENADLLESGTGSTNSDGVYLRDFTITRDLAETLQANEYDIYEFQYKVFEDTSSTFHLQVTGLDHCSNNKLDANYGEEAVDCGGPDCEACCGNGVCDSEIENYTTCPVECSAPLIKEARWGVSSPLILDPQSLVDGVNLEMWLYNADNPPTVEFRLEEIDPFLNSNDLIFENKRGYEKSSTDSLYIWNATLEDFNSANDGESDNIYTFVFEAEGEKSNELEIQLTDPLPTCDDNITNGYETGKDCGGNCEPCLCATETTCGDYIDNKSCNSDICGVLEGSTAGTICSWNKETDNCVETLFVSTNDVDIGVCYYNENTEDDTCEDDGYLSYTVDAEWEWAPQNSKSVEPEAPGWIDVNGTWHYDPERASENCKDAEKTIACPAQAQLPFFTWQNIIAVILLLLILYISINMRRKNKKKKKENQQKTMKKIKKDIDKDSKPKTITKKKPTTKKKATTKKKSATNKKSTKKPTKKKTTSKKKK